jgi:hypothetical protein
MAWDLSDERSSSTASGTCRIEPIIEMFTSFMGASFANTQVGGFTMRKLLSVGALGIASLFALWQPSAADAQVVIYSYHHHHYHHRYWRGPYWEHGHYHHGYYYYR